MSESSTSSTWLTQEAFDRLTAELARRKEADRKEIAARVEAARQEGDLRENAGYHAAREEAGLNEARIAQLTELLEHAQIGEAADDGSVSAGTIVKARVAGKEQARRSPRTCPRGSRCSPPTPRWAGPSWATRPARR